MMMKRNSLTVSALLRAYGFTAAAATPVLRERQADGGLLKKWEAFAQHGAFCDIDGRFFFAPMQLRPRSITNIAPHEGRSLELLRSSVANRRPA